MSSEPKNIPQWATYLLAAIIAALLGWGGHVIGTLRDPWSFGVGFFASLTAGLARSQLEKAKWEIKIAYPILAGVMISMIVLWGLKQLDLPPPPPERAVVVFPLESDRVPYQVSARGYHENVDCDSRSLWFVVKDMQPRHYFYRIQCKPDHIWVAQIVQFGGQVQDQGCSFESTVAIAAPEAASTLASQPDGLPKWPSGLKAISSKSAITREGSPCKYGPQPTPQ